VGPRSVRLVLGFVQGGEVEAVGDLDLGVLEAFGQGAHGSGGDNAATLDRDEFAGGDRGDAMSPRPSMPLTAPLRAFGVM